MDEEVMLPEARFIAGPIVATVWPKTVDADGRLAMLKSVTIAKVLRDRDGEWRTSNCFALGELAEVQLVAAHAYNYIMGNSFEFRNGVPAAPAVIIEKQPLRMLRIRT